MKKVPSNTASQSSLTEFDNTKILNPIKPDLKLIQKSQNINQ